MRQASFQRQFDGSVLVQLHLENGPCDLCAVNPDLTVTFLVMCPPILATELIWFLVRATEVLLLGKAVQS